MDRMELYEVKAVMDYDYYAYKDGWEQSRLVAYLVAQTNSSKQLKQSDIVKFHWDRQEENTSISNADVERLRAQAKQFENLLNTE